ncbi:sulfurtransferase complex subunit TusB [Rhodoferax sp. BAB1]|uniref:sulfurtransferase complex subunit TusB n=1 Tax=Rhodoferax sp. BAB1 TaxID=2741720 RepID=UPI0015762E87|nr:sulfurtransferase complex subunit TusB [Rhodoferax sp. BAB1]QKO21210.1 sulfurtransferase complex subunit TusB [Rhodoferax sp. BAB1]
MLHIVNKSPTAARSLESCLRMALPGQAVLLIEDGVYAATTGSSSEAQLRAAAGKVKLYALKPDLDARGMSARALDNVTLVDYGGFVDLVAEHGTPNSWL